MRPAGRGELDSLYFRYPRFAPPERGATFSAETPVAIVGGGPVGLVAALTLARFGVSSIVLEKKSTFNDGSRAICVSRSSFHIFDRVGAVEPFLAKALGWTTGRSFYRGRQFLEFRMPHDEHERYMPMYNIQQQYIEQYLFDAAKKSELIDIRWCSEAVAVRQNEARVEIDVKDPNGDYVLQADWLLAADGAKSPLRSMLGLRLKGENLEGRYVIVDVRMEHHYPTIRRALFDPDCNPDATVLIHRQPENIWRIDYQLKPDEDAAQATTEKNVRTKIAAILEEIGHKGPWELEWWSVYTANTLLLDDYRRQRVFFIGDSAHIVPIFGVRGLNNGLADAENIAWKLAMVERGAASERLLESYSPERRGATLDVFANAVKSARFMTPPTRGYQLMRDAALSLALTESFAAGFANPRQMTPYTYADSPLTQRAGMGETAGPLPGTMAPNARVADGGNFCDRLSRAFTILSFGAEAGVSEARERLHALEPESRLLIAGERPPADGGEFVADAEGEIARRFGAEQGDVFLIRPDLYLAGRWRGKPVGVAVEALSRILGRLGD